MGRGAPYITTPGLHPPHIWCEFRFNYCHIHIDGYGTGYLCGEPVEYSVTKCPDLDWYEVPPDPCPDCGRPCCPTCKAIEREICK